MNKLSEILSNKNGRKVERAAGANEPLPKQSCKMNKLLPFSVLITGLCAGCLCESHDAISRDNFRGSLAVHRTRDFRTVFRSEADIESFETDHVCSIEAGGNISRQRSISVGNGLPLGNVVRLLYGHNYDGQIKVISRNTIVQTSQVDYDPAAQTKIIVNPGDLVFIESRD